MTNFLSDPGDPNEVSVVFARRANVEVLRAMEYALSLLIANYRTRA